ncbi:hypothetical protein ACOMHN_056383 [Nucella lapillus]
MHHKTFHKKADKLYSKIGDFEGDLFARTAQYVRQVHAGQAGITLGSDDVLDISVSFDGTWLTRGHSSHIGVGCVVDLLTGLCIDAHVMCTYCQVCESTGKKIHSEKPMEYAAWIAQHLSKCDKNFKGSSGMMEVEAARVLWRRSVERYKLRYTVLLSDGDAKTFTELTSIKPYGDKVHIEKEECINHVSKRLGSALRNLVADCRKKGVTLGGRGHGQLTQNAIRKLTIYYNRAIRKSSSAEEMKKAVMASLHHCYSTDSKPRHELCPESTSHAIAILSNQVRLDHAVQSGTDSLSKIDLMLSELTLSLPQHARKWYSVETLLDFLFPPGLVTYHMTSVLEFCLSVVRKAPTTVGIHHQIERYLQYLWSNPGRVGRGKSQNVLKERCKSTAWMVQASLLVPLFKLDIQVDQCCNEAELQLSKERPDWVRKRHKYALLSEPNCVIFLARRHLDAVRFLQPGNFNPFEALIKFTKFVKLLLDRREISLFPDLPIFLFWMEVFVSIALCLAVKLRGKGRLYLPGCYPRLCSLNRKGRLYLPGCYPRLLKLFNLTLPSAQRGDLWRLMDEFKPNRTHTLKLLHDRIEILGLMLYGNKSTTNSFCLLNHLLLPKKRKSNTFVLAERSLILALTLLVNVEQGNVPQFCETPILQCIHKIRLEECQALPPRVALLIAQIQQAGSYRDVMDSVSHCLSSFNERAGFFQWRWSRERAEGLVPLSSAEGPSGGQFQHFRPEALQRGGDGGGGDVDGGAVGVGVGYLGGGGGDGEWDVPEAMDQIDDVDQQRIVIEEEEIDEEEKAMFQQQINEAEQEEKKTKAVKILVKFLRSIRLHKRLKHLKFHFLRQTELDMFSPFSVTDKMCGICGVSFEKSSENPTQMPDGGESKSGEEEEEEGGGGGRFWRMLTSSRPG